MSEWKPCWKRTVQVEYREQEPGDESVSTREGLTPLKSDDLIIRGVQGECYPIGRAIFEQTYTTDPPASDAERDALIAALREALQGVMQYARFCEKQDADGFSEFGGAENIARARAALALTPAGALDAIKREVAERVREAFKAAIHGTNTNHSATYCALEEPMRGTAYIVAHELERYWIDQIDALDLSALLAEARHE